MRYFFFFILVLPLLGCSTEPSDLDLKNIVDQKNVKFKAVVFEKKILGLGIADVLGVNDIEILNVEKIKCNVESNGSKVYYCAVAIKYSVSGSNNSLISLVGLSGVQVEVYRLKLVKIANNWEILDYRGGGSN